MTVKLYKDTYILGYWFAEHKSGDSCYLIVLKQKNDDFFRGQLTYRMHKDPDPWADKDIKNRYEITCPKEDSEDKIINDIGILFEGIRNDLGFNAYFDSFIVQGDTDKFMKLSANKNYMNLKSVQ